MSDWTERKVRAEIRYDRDTDGQVPKLLIDGKEYTWEEFGEELMTYEGWQLEFRIVG